MAEMPTEENLGELTELAQRHLRLFVRWSRGPADEQNDQWGPLRRPAAGQDTGPAARRRGG